MRLVCPNCSAQYEIDGSMIPEEGRDVQCSNCGHTWFELPNPTAVVTQTLAEPNAIHEGDEEDIFDTPPSYDLDDDDGFEDDDETARVAPQTAPPDFLSREDFESDENGARGFSSWGTQRTDEIQDSEEPERVADVSAETDVLESEPAEETEDEGEYWGNDPELSTEDAASEEPEPDGPFDFVDDGDEDAGENPVQDTALAAGLTAGGRRPADGAALDILREEAERELSQRRAPSAASMETQADLGLDDIRQRRTPSRALRARMAHLGEDAPEDEPAPILSEPAPVSRHDEDDGYEAPRRDLLPDIDEINSTLKRDNPAMRDKEAVRRSGFRMGFLAITFLTITAIFAYAQAPAIARALPQAEPSIISYVDWANGLRDWISGLTSN